MVCVCVCVCVCVWYRWWREQGERAGHLNQHVSLNNYQDTTQALVQEQNAPARQKSALEDCEDRKGSVSRCPVR